MPKSKTNKNPKKVAPKLKIPSQPQPEMACEVSPLEQAERRGYLKAQQEHTYSYNAAKVQTLNAIGQTIQALARVLEKL